MTIPGTSNVLSIIIFHTQVNLEFKKMITKSNVFIKEQSFDCDREIATCRAQAPPTVESTQVARRLL